MPCRIQFSSDVEIGGVSQSARFSTIIIDIDEDFGFDEIIGDLTNRKPVAITARGIATRSNRTAIEALEASGAMFVRTEADTFICVCFTGELVKAHIEIFGESEVTAYVVLTGISYRTRGRTEHTLDMNLYPTEVLHIKNTQERLTKPGVA